jgi:hypothetical protein
MEGLADDVIVSAELADVIVSVTVEEALLR